MAKENALAMIVTPYLYQSLTLALVSPLPVLGLGLGLGLMVRV